MSWLPEDYQVPQGSSQFMKLVKGTNKFRVIGKPIMGFEWWEENSDGRKPFRVKTFEEAVKSGTEPIKHFWAFAVYNYGAKAVQVLQITQKTIMRAIEGLQADEDWGSPENYDLVINRTGEGLETEYTVQPKPASKISKEIKEIYEKSDIDLEKLFDGEYPMGDEISEKQVDEANETIPF